MTENVLFATEVGAMLLQTKYPNVHRGYFFEVVTIMFCMENESETSKPLLSRKTGFALLNGDANQMY